MISLAAIDVIPLNVRFVSTYDLSICFVVLSPASI